MSKYDRYYIFDDPIPYKGLLLCPVKLRDYMLFLTLASCLTLEKNSIKDPILALKSISMTYLEFMDSLSERDANGKIVAGSPLSLFVGMMAIVLGKKDDKDFEISFYTDNKTGRPLFRIVDEMYDSNDLKELREIISEQNDIELPDEKKQKEVRDSIEEARKFKQRLAGNKTANLEEQITALSLYSGWDLDKIYSMTIRKFHMSIHRANHMIMSNLYLSASLMGTTFKDPSATRGWLADLTVENKDADVTMSVDALQSKISFEDAKK